LYFEIVVAPARLDCPATANQINNQNDRRYHEKQVDQAAADVREQANEPQDQ
jgi:hypothetical protein